MTSPRELTAALRLLFADMDRAVAWRLGATVLLVVAGGLVSGLSPLALKGMIDTATGALVRHDRSALHATATFGALYLIALGSGRLLSELRPALIGAAEQRLYARLRRRFFAHLLELPMAFHAGQRTGGLVQVLHQAISGYQVVLLNLINSALPVLVELATVALVLGSLGQPALATTFAATALAYVAVLGLRKFGIGARARAVSEASIEAHALLADSVVNIEAIKCFNAAGDARDGFGRTIDALEGRWEALRRSRLRLGLTLTATFTASMAASLAVAVDAVLDGSLSIGGFVLANVYMLQLARPLEAIGAAARDVSQAMAYIRPLMEVLAQPIEGDGAAAGSGIAQVHEDAGAVPNDTPGTSEARPISRHPVPCVSFHSVRFAYDGTKPILDELCLDIAAGRAIAIVGASGSGKSSLVRLLLRLYEPQAGSISLDGVELNDLPLKAVRSRIAVVPQETLLFNVSIAWNIGIGRTGATRCDIERAARLARAHQFITSMPAGYDTVVGERGVRLSGGERQRIAIARAILKDPAIYVFDEATSMLDSLTEQAILHDLQEISAGRTTITIAHRLSTIQHVHEILVLDRGRVAERGEHANLLAHRGIYAAMWHAQQGQASEPLRT